MLFTPEPYNETERVAGVDTGESCVARSSCIVAKCKAGCRLWRKLGRRTVRYRSVAVSSARLWPFGAISPDIGGIRVDCFPISWRCARRYIRALPKIVRRTI